MKHNKAPENVEAPAGGKEARTAVRAALGLAALGAAGLLIFVLAYARYAPGLLQRLDFNTGEVLMKQGTAFEDAGEPENAKERYLIALQSRFQGEQNRAFTQKRLGALYWHEQDLEAALPLLRAAAANPAAAGNVYEPLADTLFQLKRYDEAQEAVDRWLAASQENPAQRAEALFHLGRIALARGARAEGIARFQESDALAPGGRAASELAPLYFADGRYQDALNVIDAYLEKGAAKGRAEYIRRLRERVLEKLGQSSQG